MMTTTRFMKVELIGPTSVNGKIGWLVIVHWLDGQTETYFFDTEEEALAMIKDLQDGFDRLRDE